ncbi:MAG: hypothetical protein LBE36_06410 [Flavobacteriaceae bacterium]|jgi:hypothetical protein|nr:hypothetical protein [Flavobacteriaceae bacterium]
MNNTGVVLAVAIGSTVFLRTGGTLPLSSVPENAYELLESGATYLKLNSDAEEILLTWEKERLQNFLQLRKSQGMDSDVKILEKVLKKLSKPKSNKGINPLAEV